MIQFFQLSAAIRYRAIYKCAACHTTAVADTESKEFDGSSGEELRELLSNMRLTSRGMPVGWSYNGRFTCPSCNRGESDQ